ncbi:MAG TPA: 30S ribosomal protein S6 [Bryobacteraceae bacterium]|nr:30S ribosomal protein S6 [Bryobacteraceae bacterium]
MRIYEELFIVRPDATDEEVDPVIEQLRNVITQSGGTIDKTEKWGVRKLAYRVMKQTEGQYILLQFTANADIVKEIERRLRVSDVVMKFITVRIDEKMKFFEKRRKAREARAARKPPAPAPAPAMAAPSHPGEPAAPVPGAPVTPAPPAPAAPAEAGARPGGEQPTEGTI